MAASKEKISVILMRDSGESKRYRMYRSRFRKLIAFSVLSPLISVAALGACYWFWEQNKQLYADKIILEQENHTYQITTKRLQHLEVLLKRQTTVEKKIAVRIAAEEEKEKTIVSAVTEKAEKEDLTKEGPGHAEFPVVDTGVLKVSGVSAGLVDKDRIRVAFNLRNGGKESISGEVYCILSLADGKTIPLKPDPEDAGTYKIANFKSAVLFLDIDQSLNLTNAEIILEAKDAEGIVIFRNLYSLSQ